MCSFATNLLQILSVNIPLQFCLEAFLLEHCRVNWAYAGCGPVTGFPKTLGLLVGNRITSKAEEGDPIPSN